MLPRLLYIVVVAAVAGCAASPPPKAPALEPPVVEDTAAESYRWLEPAWKDTCRKVPTYGLGGRPGPRPWSRREVHTTFVIP